LVEKRKKVREYEAYEVSVAFLKAPKMIRKTIFSISFMFLLFSSAQAWGPDGHSVVAELAQRRLTPVAVQNIHKVLGKTASLSSYASWADDVREENPQTHNEHFVNIPLMAHQYVEGLHCFSTPRGDCVVKAIERSIVILRNDQLSAPQRRNALKYLIHYVADLHQPLHTVQELGGGNGLPVKFYNNPTQTSLKKTNLHAVWDEGIIRAQYYSWGEYAEHLDVSWIATKSNAEMARLSAGTHVDWVNEAHEYARLKAYPVEKDQILGKDYLEMAKPIVDRQLAVASLRLSKILNTIFK
jgi:nuclease S1